jgi:uncharacterized protein (UPF0261 family)
MGMPIVVLIGTLDTKGDEVGFLRDRLRGGGVETVPVDVGTHGPLRIEPDVVGAAGAAAGMVRLDRKGRAG